MLGKLMNTYHIYTACMNLALSRSSVLECFERSNASKIRNRAMFDFYPGLPHIVYFFKIHIAKCLKLCLMFMVISQNYTP